MTKIKLLLLSAFLIIGCTRNEGIKNKNSKEVDSLFHDYKETPGAAVGIIKKGKLIYAKGFGLSNLDYNIPITSDSKFYIGSMAKQFCGAALLKLESDGMIDFSKPINFYLDDFPIYDEIITIDQIIHHTSGIRGTSSMQLIAGINNDFEEFFTANQQYELIKSQSELNFTPGSEFRYSSGGYVVLAKLVERISGKSFRQYLEENIFTPLGMDDTMVVDNHQEVVENRVISYFQNSTGYERRSMIFDGMGDGSILTTINDLAKWDKAFYDDNLLDIPDFSNKMYNSGKVLRGNDFYYGMALQTSDHKGHMSVHHNGGMLGFRADLVRFPEEELSIIVLANNSIINSTGKAFEVADFYLPSKTENAIENVPSEFPSISKEYADQLIGKYFSDDLNMWRRITYENDTLFYDSGNLDYKVPLLKTTSTTFQITQFDSPIKLKFNGDYLNIDYGWVCYNFQKFNDALPNWNDLTKYIGNYYSDELNTYYRVFKQNNRLKIQVNNNEPFEIFPKPSDTRINWNSKSMVWLGYAMMKFKFDDLNKIEGFNIGDNRVRGIYFEKLD